LPFDYLIDKKRRLIVSSVEGPVTVAEVRSKIGRLLEDPDFDPRLNELIDATRVTEVNVPATQALEFAGQRILSTTSRTAWVVRNSIMWRTLAELLAAYMSIHTEAAVFSDVPSALEWIDASRGSV
jgi:hypothetical protein